MLHYSLLPPFTFTLPPSCIPPPKKKIYTVNCNDESFRVRILGSSRSGKFDNQMGMKRADEDGSAAVKFTYRDAASGSLLLGDPRLLATAPPCLKVLATKDVVVPCRGYWLIYLEAWRCARRVGCKDEREREREISNIKT